METNRVVTECDYAGPHDDPGFPLLLDRILLYLTLAAGYTFLGFFGWLLTL